MALAVSPAGLFKDFCIKITPVVKAYVSDQAWRICELAIQTCGGRGYLKQLGLEQYARDVKVLSIWEGTNYVQSQDLIRDKLGLGNESKLYRIFRSQINGFLDKSTDYPDLESEFKSLKSALESLDEMLKLVRQWIKNKSMEKIPAYSTRILQAFGEVTLSWLLIAGACAARDELSRMPDEKLKSYCEGKIASAKFFVFNILPNVHSTLSIMKADESFIKLPHQVWAYATEDVE
ncbi:MAG: acyl-CoA dehydrogenase C-terminal domain-containing protein [Kangiellaceae bacterium]|nr:acyl-CoA dehydrogenase C-terminal domain-containing protein [Kangiellaceae bacterium]